MDKYFLFDNKICNNGVAMENRSVVDSLNHLFKENQSLRKSISEQHNKIVDLETKLAEKEKEIVDKIRSKCCVEDKCKDGSFVLGINEKDLDTILKEYGGKDE